MSEERAKIYLKSALSEFELYESLGIKDYLKSAHDNMVKALKELEEQNMDSNYDVIQGDCPCCPFADLFGGFCFYYRFYPANIGYGEATCRCEELKPMKD